MKQHITIEQLNELSNKRLLRYHHWCKSKGYCDSKDGMNLLSIGQMIEFLDEQVQRHNAIVDRDDDGEYAEYTIERLLDGCFRMDGYFKTTEYDDLCDALWEAVKEVLEENR